MNLQFSNSIVPKCEEEILFTFQNLFIRSFSSVFPSLFCHFPLHQTPWGIFLKTSCIVLLKVAKLQVCVVVSVSQGRTDINCLRTDSECVYMHKVYSDITGETKIFILGTSICKCHILLTITGINVNMTAEMG